MIKNTNHKSRIRGFRAGLFELSTPCMRWLVVPAILTEPLRHNAGLWFQGRHHKPWNLGPFFMPHDFSILWYPRWVWQLPVTFLCSRHGRSISVCTDAFACLFWWFCSRWLLGTKQASKQNLSGGISLPLLSWKKGVMRCPNPMAVVWVLFDLRTTASPT